MLWKKQKHHVLFWCIWGGRKYKTSWGPYPGSVYKSWTFCWIWITEKLSAAFTTVTFRVELFAVTTAATYTVGQAQHLCDWTADDWAGVEITQTTNNLYCSHNPNMRITFENCWCSDAIWNQDNVVLKSVPWLNNVAILFKLFFLLTQISTVGCRLRSAGST